jgi:NAD(P)-dependent dehydrogenase (short-subunit alcohol dehydrogenase family)
MASVSYLNIYQILNAYQIVAEVKQGRKRMSGARDGRWTAADVPDQSGRVAVVTGASAGIGLETARVLAARGATVVLACRDLAKAGRSAEQIRAGTGPAAGGAHAGAALAAVGHAQSRARQPAGPGQDPARQPERGSPAPDVRVVQLDLASLASVRAAASEVRAAFPRLDLLINNAGVMGVPYQRTEDGFELTFATNHLGHFALTGLLLDRLCAAPGARIVTVSSRGHHSGVMNFDDLQGERRYRPERAYWQSKLANLLFSYELQRRLAAAGAGPSALAAHPGVVLTELWRTSSRLERAAISPRLRLLNFWLAQSVAMGALPTLRATTDPGARGGEYYGPARRHDTGYPARVESSARSHDETDQRRLWDVSERLTGVQYHLP